MKQYILIVLIMSGLVLGGCVKTESTTSTDSETQVPAAEEKSGDTVKSGMLVKQGTKYYIKSPAGIMDEVESYAVNFSEYENKSVTVTGQYSGDTLFAGSIILVE